MTPERVSKHATVGGKPFETTTNELGKKTEKYVFFCNSEISATERFRGIYL